MKTHIKQISNGSDYEVVSWPAGLVGTCGTRAAAQRLNDLIRGAHAALLHLSACDDKESRVAEDGAEAITLLKKGLGFEY